MPNANACDLLAEYQKLERESKFASGLNRVLIQDRKFQIFDELPANYRQELTTRFRVER